MNNEKLEKIAREAYLTHWFEYSNLHKYKTREDARSDAMKSYDRFHWTNDTWTKVVQIVLEMIK